jgi:HK97 family phage major capsid protein
MTMLYAMDRMNRDQATAQFAALMNEALEQSNRDKVANEFAQLAKFIMASGGITKAAYAIEKQGSKAGLLGPKLAAIVEAGGAGEISREALLRQKAAATAGTLSSLADYSTITNGFVNSLVNASAFDGMLASMVPVPLMTGSVGAVSVGATAYSLGEGSAKPISKLSIVGQQVNPAKAHCFVVVTQELARATGAQATALIGRDLRNAVSITTDYQFIAALISGLSVATSAGPTAEAVRADISNLLRAITIGQSSKLFLITTPLICQMWSMLTDSKGVSAFPDLTPTGGSINGITVIPDDGLKNLITNGVTTANVILVDASGIAAASGDVAFQEFTEGTFQGDSAPDSPISASTSFISLWQMNLTAIVVERFFLAVRLRSDAVAVCTNSNSYQGGNSPP